MPLWKRRSHLEWTALGNRLAPDAIRIARDWNVPASGVGYVTRFEVQAGFAERYPVRQLGGATILELWIPAEELDEFNRHIVGRIEVVHEFRATISAQDPFRTTVRPTGRD
ncbi:hypothetical protein NONO_c12360 [Nocardia nova SH22a]|uniref:Uncharacterized protein n=1 Tax=Nocardia nova SH22a TaxID=1415166 RepID=W5TAM7_9NOCA|nr:hypothetical protein [Nocardia nova]AHH16043.1 hypothetical protein NONO_c12360 [Nocardia nova SH22a]